MQELFTGFLLKIFFMVFQGVSFNDEWVKSKTEAEFIAHESHHGLSEKQLKEVYGLIVPKKIIIDVLEKERKKIDNLTEKPSVDKADGKAQHE